MKSKVGHLHLILGPMFASKTTELFKIIEQKLLIGLKCLVIKYSDDRFSNDTELITHSNMKLDDFIKPLSGSDSLITKDFIPILSVKSVENSIEKSLSLHQYENFDCIIIDEVQFYDDASFMCDKLANQGFEVIACGLSGTFERKPFKPIAYLVSQADKITHLRAICRETGHKAPFSFRTSDEMDEKVIGGADKYKAVDRKTFLKNIKDK